MARTAPTLVVGGRQNFTLTTTGASYSLNTLSGIATDDLILLGATFVNTNPAVTNLNGWTQLYFDTVNTRKFGMWYRRRLSGDGASYSTPTFTSTGAGGFSDFQQTAWRGVDWAEAIVSGTVYKRPSSIATMAIPSITVVDGTTSILMAWEASNTTESADTESVSGGTGTWTRAQGFAAQTVASSNIEHVTSWYQAFATGGATGSPTMTFPNTGSNGAAVQIGLVGLNSGGTDYAASGSVDLTSTAVGDVTLQATVAGVIASTSAVVGDLTKQTSASGTIPVVSVVTGTVSGPLASGTVAVVSTVSGAVSQSKAVSGTVAITSVAVGAVTKRTSASGTVAVVSGTVGSASVAPATGRCGSAIVGGFSTTHLTAGWDKLAGTVHEAVLFDAAGTTELSRATLSFDAYGWGSATFTGLTPNTRYRIRAQVDGAYQTDTKFEGTAIKTLATGVVSSFVAIAGSCNFTGSNHPVWDNIAAENPVFLAHMGDLHYVDATAEAAWRAGMESSLTAAKMKTMLQGTMMNWVPDNHDIIRTTPAGGGSADTATAWKNMAGSYDHASSDSLGRSWRHGRILFIHPDLRTARDNYNSGGGTVLFGAAQKTWLGNLIDAAAADSSIGMVVFLSTWTARNDGSGRWDSYPAESSWLEGKFNAYPALKAKTVMVGGDSHVLQADSGARTGSLWRFSGIPSLNISGFNRSSQYATGGWDIAEADLRTSGQAEADWGGYSRMTFADDGSTVSFTWDAVRINAAGTPDVMATWSKSFGSGNHAASGTVAVNSAASGTIGKQQATSGSIAAVTAVSGAVTKQSLISSTVPVVSTAVGTVFKPMSAAGTIPVVTATAGTVTEDGPAAGVVPIASSISGSVFKAQTVSGTVAVVSNTSGSANPPGSIVGTVVVGSTVVGSVTKQSSFAGSVPVVSTVVGDVGRNQSLSGTVSLSSAVSGTVTKQSSISAQVAALTSVIGAAVRSTMASGTIPVNSAVSGSLTSVYSAAGSVIVLSSVSGTATGGTDFERPEIPVNRSVSVVNGNKSIRLISTSHSITLA